MSQPRRVLIVEDEVITGLELKLLVERLGLTVLEIVSSGERAVERSLALRPDLLLMDVHLDGPMDGIEASARIREHVDVPVIFLTSYGDDETVQRANDIGAFGYVLKPFQERELHATIEVAMKRHEQQHHLRRSHDDLQQILDGLRIGTAMTDSVGNITFLSRVARTLLGLDPAQGIGASWQHVFPFDRHAKDTLRASFEGTSPQGRIEATTRTPKGREYRLEVDVQVDPRNPARRIFSFYDLTEMYNLREQLRRDRHFEHIIGESPEMQAVFQQIDSVARIDTTVLIEGETGTGKELVAQAIHEASHRKSGPFIAVNCAALTESLAASQLFGHKRGAFTGAVSDERGLFGAAEGGTLFLDEIGDIPMDVQVNLLRVLEQRQVTRVGETKPRNIDVRIVAASHRNLPAEVLAGNFRADLLYRIRVARIELPALRGRRVDIPVLARTFLMRFAERIGKQVDGISDKAMRALLDYSWPGNVRELRNAIEYAVIRTEGSVLRDASLPPEIRSGDLGVLRDETASEKDRMRAALEHTNGNRKEAAALLGISRATFYRRLAEFGLE